MKQKTLRVGAAQIFTAFDLEANLSKLDAAIRSAAEQGVELLLFPECALSGYAPISDDLDCESPYDPKQIKKAFKKVAGLGRDHRMALIVGTAWKDDRLGWVNRVLVTHPNGRLAGFQDKSYLIGNDLHYFNPSERIEPLTVCGVRIGIGVCFDIRFPEVWRTLSRKGAQILFNPLAAYGGGIWKRPVMSAHLRSRAAENQRFAVSANNGPLQMAVSEIFDPSGLRLAEANPEVEEVISAELRIGEFEAKGRRKLPDFLPLVRDDLHRE